MILQALKEYYDRKAQDPDSALAPEGFEKKEIPFVIVLDKHGSLVQIEDTRSWDGRKKRAKTFLVPQGEKKSVNVAANLLWGNAEYVLGIPDAKKLEDRKLKGTENDYHARLEEMRGAFVEKIKNLALDDASVLAVLEFCKRVPLDELENQGECWEEICATNPNITFRLVGERNLVCQHPLIIKALQQNSGDEETARPTCLITGEPSEIERLHPAIKGVRGAQTSGANIVSFNLRSFESYGKEKRQGENAPTSKAVAFAYTTALNSLLGKDSKQRIRVGRGETAATPSP